MNRCKMIKPGNYVSGHQVPTCCLAAGHDGMHEAVLTQPDNPWHGWVWWRWKPNVEIVQPVRRGFRVDA